MSYAVVSGAASGIGALVRKRLETQGYDVIGIDLKNTEVTADLSTAAGREAAIADALEKCGGKIDRMVLAAGLATNGRSVVIGSNSSQMRTDPNNPMVEAMLEGDEGKAMEAIGDQHAAGVYGHSKHAVTRAVRRRAAEWGALGITVNVIAPGPTETAMLQGVKDHPTISKSLDMIPIPQKGSVIYVDGGTDAQLRPDAF